MNKADKKKRMEEIGEFLVREYGLEDKTNGNEVAMVLIGKYLMVADRPYTISPFYMVLVPDGFMMNYSRFTMGGDYEYDGDSFVTYPFDASCDDCSADCICRELVERIGNALGLMDITNYGKGKVVRMRKGR